MAKKKENKSYKSHKDTQRMEQTIEKPSSGVKKKSKKQKIQQKIAINIQLSDNGIDFSNLNEEMQRASQVRQDAEREHLIKNMKQQVGVHDPSKQRKITEKKLSQMINGQKLESEKDPKEHQEKIDNFYNDLEKRIETQKSVTIKQGSIGYWDHENNGAVILSEHGKLIPKMGDFNGEYRILFPEEMLFLLDLGRLLLFPDRDSAAVVSQRIKDKQTSQDDCIPTPISFENGFFYFDQSRTPFYYFIIYQTLRNQGFIARRHLEKHFDLYKESESESESNTTISESSSVSSECEHQLQSETPSRLTITSRGWWEQVSVPSNLPKITVEGDENTVPNLDKGYLAENSGLELNPCRSGYSEESVSSVLRNMFVDDFEENEDEIDITTFKKYHDKIAFDVYPAQDQYNWRSPPKPKFVVVPVSSIQDIEFEDWITLQRVTCGIPVVAGVCDLFNGVTFIQMNDSNLEINKSIH